MSDKSIYIYTDIRQKYFQQATQRQRKGTLEVLGKRVVKLMVAKKLK